MAPARIALLVQLGSTLPLVGVIWLVQIVAYPLFARVGTAEFAAYHEAHARLITVVVAPLMIAELASSLVGTVYTDALMPPNAARLGAALAIAVWLFTALVSVPQHEALTRSFDGRTHALLVVTNWLRTVAWTFRGAILLWAVARA